MQYLYKQIILARTLFKRLSWIAYGCNDGERYFRKKKQNKETCDENMFGQVSITGDERQDTPLKIQQRYEKIRSCSRLGNPEKIKALYSELLM